MRLRFTRRAAEWRLRRAGRHWAHELHNARTLVGAAIEDKCQPTGGRDGLQAAVRDSIDEQCFGVAFGTHVANTDCVFSGSSNSGWCLSAAKSAQLHAEIPEICERHAMRRVRVVFVRVGHSLPLRVASAQRKSNSVNVRLRSITCFGPEGQ